MPRKTIDERIAIAKTKIEQEQEKLKDLLSKHKEQERKERTHRLCKRMGLMESLLPDLASLSDEQFQTFLNRTVLKDFGRNKLAELAEQADKSSAPKSPNTPQSTAPILSDGDGGTSDGVDTNAADSAEDMKP